MGHMKIIICQNSIKNYPLTNEDVNLTNRMFGPDISTLKGQYTLPKTVQVIDDLIEI